MVMCQRARILSEMRNVQKESRISDTHKQISRACAFRNLKWWQATILIVTILLAAGYALSQGARYALYSLLCLVLNREAAENLGRPDKAVSPTYFNT